MAWLRLHGRSTDIKPGDAEGHHLQVLGPELGGAGEAPTSRVKFKGALESSVLKQNNILMQYLKMNAKNPR